MAGCVSLILPDLCLAGRLFRRPLRRPLSPDPAAAHLCPVPDGEILRITALQQLLGPIAALINMALMNFGLEPVDALMYSHAASAIGLIYLWLRRGPGDLSQPAEFRVRPARGRQGQRARPLRAFFEVTWPLNRAGTAIGVVLVFIPTLASSVTSQFLGGPDGALFGNILATSSARPAPGRSARRWASCCSSSRRW